MMACSDFTAAVRSYVGTPYVHRGRHPGVALDCAGVVVCALKEGGITAPTIHYGMCPTPAQMHEGLAAIAEPIDVGDRLIGDILAMRVRGLGDVHMAVLVDVDENGVEYVVHPSRRERITEHPLSRAYHISACWRLREVR
jgi:hypothetical protein